MSYNRRADAMRRSSGLSHRAAYPSDKRCAEAMGVHRSTPHRWAKGDPANPLHKDSQYLLLAEKPWEYVAHMSAMVKWMSVVKLSDHELIERYWALLIQEKRIEGADNLMGCEPGHPWLERSLQKRRDAAVDLELSAVMDEFAARGLTEAQVNGGAL